MWQSVSECDVMLCVCLCKTAGFTWTASGFSVTAQKEHFEDGMDGLTEALSWCATAVERAPSVLQIIKQGDLK